MTTYKITVSLLLAGLFINVIFPSCIAENKVNLCNSTANYEKYHPTGRTETCGCEKTDLCVRKCCKEGYYLERGHTEHKSTCRRNNTRSFKIPIHNGDKRMYDLTYNFMVGMLTSCNVNELWRFARFNKSDPRRTFFVQKDGTLYYPNLNVKYYNTSNYCLDELNGMTSVTICLKQPPYYYILEIAIAAKIISIPFLLSTFLVYAILQEWNLHTKALMSYVLTLLIDDIVIIVRLTLCEYYKEIREILCPSIAYWVLFLHVASVFWMNVMCIDIWLTFSGLKGFGKKQTERKQFILYCLYAYGIPLLHTIVVYLLNTFADKTKFYHPQMDKEICGIKAHMSLLLYLYGPAGIIITINIVLFILTVINIQKVKKETSILKYSDSEKHTNEDNRQRFVLYLKLFFVMGINLIMEIIKFSLKWYLGDKIPRYAWLLVDFCGAVNGVLIFFLLVFKREVWKSLQERFRCKWKIFTRTSETNTEEISTVQLESYKVTPEDAVPGSSMEIKT